MNTIFQGSLSFVFGLGIGFLHSIPFGPITISVVVKSLKRGFGHAVMIGMGAVLADVIFCTIGIFGMSMTQDHVLSYFQPLGFPVLTFLGIRMIILSKKPHSFESAEPVTATEMTKLFSAGFLTNLANPLAITFWVMMAGILFSSGLLARTFPDKTGFVAGMAVGTSAWFLTLAKVIDRRRKAVEPSTVKTLTRIMGTLLIGFGIYLGYEFVKTWNA